MSQFGIEADHLDPQQLNALPRGVFQHSRVDPFAEDFAITVLPSIERVPFYRSDAIWQ
jgi:hypothetical protein